MVYKLFLDDERQLTDVYNYTKKNVYLDNDWIVVRSYDDFVDVITTKGLPIFISFDHDIADKNYVKILNKQTDYSNFREKTGFECVKWLIDYCLDNNLEFPDYFVHSYNSVGSKNIISYIENFKRTR